MTSMHSQIPRETVQELDKYIIGQKDAKRSVAIALRNRWRRQQVESPLREEIAPDTPVEAQHLREGLTDRPHTITRLSDRRVDPRRLSRDFGPVAIAAGQIFVMGDNRDLSHDSRAFGPVDVGQVMGRAHHVAFSLDPDRWRTPRRGRWWQELI